MISTNQFKNGMCIELDGVVWKIIEFQHVKPGKGGAFVRTRLKQMEGGKVVEHWDVIQDEVKKEASVSGLPMFGDAFPAS